MNQDLENHLELEMEVDPLGVDPVEVDPVEVDLVVGWTVMHPELLRT